MVGFWRQITTLKLIHIICCRSIQAHNIIRCKAFSNTIHNFCVGNMTKSEKKQIAKTVTVIRVCVYTRRHYFISCKFDIVANSMYFFFNLLSENTIFYFIKTKQSCYYLFSLKVFTFVSLLGYTYGFKYQCSNCETNARNSA